MGSVASAEKKKPPQKRRLEPWDPRPQFSNRFAWDNTCRGTTYVPLDQGDPPTSEALLNAMRAALGPMSRALYVRTKSAPWTHWITLCIRVYIDGVAPTFSSATPIEVGDGAERTSLLCAMTSFAYDRIDMVHRALEIKYPGEKLAKIEMCLTA